MGFKDAINSFIGEDEKKKPTGKKPVSKKPTGKKPVSKKPTGKKPVSKKPTGKKMPAGDMMSKFAQQ